MATTSYKHYLVVIGLMALTGAAITPQTRAPVTGKAGVRLELPDRVGEYQGFDQLFCQNESCMKSILSKDAGEEAVCPACGSRLDRISPAEKTGLPADTIILKKQYRDPSGEEIAVTIVLSGKEQTSIHRPQQCLPAQGHVIEGSRVISVPVAGREPLKVMLLDLRTKGKTPGGREYGFLSSYAYWFVGTDRETPYHLQRLYWMARDRVFRNITHRWAYVAVAARRSETPDGHVEQISNFIHDLYPQIKK